MVDTMTDWLEQIRDAAGHADQSQARLHDAVAAARAAGISWALIGTALGVSRQAAHKRFGDVP